MYEYQKLRMDLTLIKKLMTVQYKLDSYLEVKISGFPLTDHVQVCNLKQIFLYIKLLLVCIFQNLLQSIYFYIYSKTGKGDINQYCCPWFSSISLRQKKKKNPIWAHFKCQTYLDFVSITQVIFTLTSKTLVSICLFMFCILGYIIQKPLLQLITFLWNS